MRPQETVDQRDSKTAIQYFLFESGDQAFRNNVKYMTRIDPDLSITLDVIGKYIDATGGHRSAPIIFRLMDVATRRLADVSPHTPAQTARDIRIFKRVDNILQTQSRTLQHDQKQSAFDRYAFEMFTVLNLTRRDLLQHPDFPWALPVDVAIRRNEEFMAGYFLPRMEILRQAPKDIVQKAVRFHAQNGRLITEVLGNEYDLIARNRVRITSADLWDIISMVPDRHAPSARSVVFWALEAATSRDIEQHDLTRVWRVARHKWDTLSAKDKGEFITLHILHTFASVYGHLAEKHIEPNHEMDQMRQSIIQNTSPERIAEFTEGYIELINKGHNIPLGMIAKWFPQIGSAIETYQAQTTKKPFDGLMTIFRRK